MPNNDTIHVACVLCEEDNASVRVELASRGIPGYLCLRCAAVHVCLQENETAMAPGQRALMFLPELRAMQAGTESPSATHPTDVVDYCSYDGEQMLCQACSLHQAFLSMKFADKDRPETLCRDCSAIAFLMVKTRLRQFDIVNAIRVLDNAQKWR